MPCPFNNGECEPSCPLNSKNMTDSCMLHELCKLPASVKNLESAQDRQLNTLTNKLDELIGAITTLSAKLPNASTTNTSTEDDQLISTKIMDV